MGATTSDGRLGRTPSGSTVKKVEFMPLGLKETVPVLESHDSTFRALSKKRFSQKRGFQYLIVELSLRCSGIHVAR